MAPPPDVDVMSYVIDVLGGGGGVGVIYVIQCFLSEIDVLISYKKCIFNYDLIVVGIISSVVTGWGEFTSFSLTCKLFHEIILPAL